MRRLMGWILALSLLLCGCSGGYLSGEYVSVVPHPDQQAQSAQQTPQASSFEELRDAIVGLVDVCAESGVIALVDYPVDQAKTDMRRAVDYACRVYPMGAYAVSSIAYESGTSGGGAAFSVTVSYRRTRAEMERVRLVEGSENAREAVRSALSQCESSLVLEVVGYTELDFAQVVEDYSVENPAEVMETPQVSVSLYPDKGDRRIVELTFAYQTSRESLRNMQSQVKNVFDSARLYVSGDGAEQEKFSQLYAFLMERFDYRVETSLTPAYSLLRHGVGDSKAFANVYAAMCRSAGLTCFSVSGTRDGEPWTWNILRDGGIYYHVDLLRSLEEGGFREMTDEEMERYVWDYSAYPACGQKEEPRFHGKPSNFTFDSKLGLDKREKTGIIAIVPAGVAHPVERHLAKVEVASSSLVTRSIIS